MNSLIFLAVTKYVGLVDRLSGLSRGCRYLKDDTIVIRYTIELVVSSGGALAKAGGTAHRAPLVQVGLHHPQPAKVQPPQHAAPHTGISWHSVTPPERNGGAATPPILGPQVQAGHGLRALHSRGSG